MRLPLTVVLIPLVTACVEIDVATAQAVAASAAEPEQGAAPAGAPQGGQAKAQKPQGNRAQRRRQAALEKKQGRGTRSA